jgi:hypothetical protein
MVVVGVVLLLVLEGANVRGKRRRLHAAGRLQAGGRSW